MDLLKYYLDNGQMICVTDNQVNDLIKDSSKKHELAEFLYQRLHHRYVKPFLYVSKRMIEKELTKQLVDEYSLCYKNGFSLMANCCLLIETLEAFFQGWKNTDKRSELAFIKFFSRDENFKEFSINEVPAAFYKNIRCGILHQGETTGGWSITRSGQKLLNINEKKINATKFMFNLEKSLNEYKLLLQESSWNDQIWTNARIKLKAVADNSIHKADINLSQK